MRVFYLVLFVTTLRSVELWKSKSSNNLIFDMLTKDEWLGLKYDDLHDIGALVSNDNKHIEDVISESIQVSKSFVDEVSGYLKNQIKAISLAKNAGSVAKPLFKTDVGKRFEKKAMELAGKTLKFASKLIPYASEVLDLADGLVDIFSGGDENEWKKEFEEKILANAEKTSNELDQKNNLFHVNVFMTTVKQDVQKMNKTVHCMRTEYVKDHPNENVTRVPSTLIDDYIKACDKNGVDSMASTLWVLFQNQVNAFAARNSSYMHYALLGAPVLIELSLLVSLFEPLAIELVPGVADDDPKLSCLFRDALIDHLPFVLEERFNKVNASLKNMIKVRNEPYNATGYHESIFVDCSKGCPYENCIDDKFAAEALYKKSDENACEIGYLQHLRHMVESLFPIDVLNKSCDRGWEKPTGFGWATIKLKNFKGSHLSKRTKKVSGLETYGCDDLNKCDPYVKLYVDGVTVLTTKTEDGTEDYNVDRIYNTPNMIEKNKTNITIEVLEDDSKNRGKDRNAKNSEPMLLLIGTAQSFMDDPVRCTKERVEEHSTLGGEVTLAPTCLQVDIIWQDSRE